MSSAASTSHATSVTPVVAATPHRLAIAMSGAVVVLLAALHVLSPEFDPAVRVVSEYATGKFGWVLSLMFVAWAISSWALVVAIRPHLTTRAGTIGVGVLAVAGLGEALAAIFDITHPLHGLAGFLGILGLPVAAVMISVQLAKVPAFAHARRLLLWTAHLTWASVVLMAVAMIVMMRGYAQAGNRLTPDVIALVGYPNRLLVVLYCVWVSVVAYVVMTARGHPIR